MNKYTQHYALSGTGIGLRHQHFREFIENKPNIPWLEIHTENFLYHNSAASQHLVKIRQEYPISAHCVGMSLGSTTLDQNHLNKIAKTIEWLEPVFVSDHLSWSHNAHHHMPDLLPIPYTQEALDVFVRNIDLVQSQLKRRILIENPSSYLSYSHSTMPEWEFLTEVATRTGCGLLLDLNNIYVSAHNHQFDAFTYLQALPKNAVQEIHLAGFETQEVEGHTLYIDTHSKPVYAPVWKLYEQALTHFGAIPTLIEWDNDIPELPVLLAEQKKATAILTQYQQQAA